MPWEARQIGLSTAELLDAVQSYRRRVEDFLPRGQITRCVPSDAAVQVTVEASYSGTTHKLDYQIDPETLREVAVRFCIANNIPIPRAGEKRVRITGEGIVLEITLAAAATHEQVQIGAAPAILKRERAGQPAVA
jgi:hypothetical protein